MSEDIQHVHIKNAINKLNHLREKLERKISCVDSIVQYGSETCRQTIILREKILAVVVIIHGECNVCDQSTCTLSYEFNLSNLTITLSNL